MLIRVINAEKNKKKKKKKIYEHEDEIFIEFLMEQNPNAQTVTIYFEAINTSTSIPINNELVSSR